MWKNQHICQIFILSSKNLKCINYLLLFFSQKKRTLTAKKELKWYVKINSKCVNWINLASWKITIIFYHFISEQWKYASDQHGYYDWWLELTIYPVFMAKFYFVTYSQVLFNDGRCDYNNFFPVSYAFSSFLVCHKLIDSLSFY